MKKLSVITLSVLLAGCFSDTSDLKQYMADVQSTTKAYVDPMPQITPFNHVDYQAGELRSPFDIPRPEAIQKKIQQMSGCLSPDPRRRKQPLEKFALSDLAMRGHLENWMSLGR